ncbi:MBL fold metallo-hydrolase [Microcoleus sp. FACHB-831]|uniref:MBL fold metallo-hydrolase n=1 Tax=Microcoleus sp. FACHB-831 TaxID=2692827 RepID=UPI001684A01E|nr:MBL fold metallo-hydrolase [Microcoleus sp. FACHB-831]MBD1920895.1 MBL fold metallo-hydrolase [Microcoleus sp. FACHB-831]
MKRRELMRYAGAGLLAAMGTGLTSGFRSYQAATPSGSLSVQWLGHTCFLFSGSGLKVLVNPFRKLGCTAGYRSPKVASDVVLISSQMLDEGAIEDLPGEPKFLYEPGAYKVEGLQLQGISLNHDREGGRRFGTNVAWRWTQGGINILHLGGAAAPIEVEQKILMGRPDVVLVPVGGGPKAYKAEEAMQAVQALNPKLVIPTHYRTQAADANSCDLASLDEFLGLANGMNVRRVASDTISIKPADIAGNGSAIAVLSYKF